MHSVFHFGMDIKSEVSKWGFGPKNVEAIETQNVLFIPEVV